MGLQQAMPNMSSRTPLMINVGCGANPTSQWVNYDNSLTVRLTRFPALLRALSAARVLSPSQRAFADAVVQNGVRWGDAARLVDWPDNSVDALYSSHMLEHLQRPVARHFLLEAKRVLVAGGILRLAVPDLAILVRRYLETGDADTFIASTLLTRERPDTLLAKLRWLTIGDRDHAWMYNEASLVAMLLELGYEAPAAVPAGETSIPDSGALDLREREEESLYVEARKPRRP